MKEFSNNRIVTLDDLEESGNYKQDLLENIKAGNFRFLSDISIDNRANLNYMEPLLYAVRNRFNTFSVYTYYAESLQNNSKLASEIIVNEPNLIEDTPMSRDRQFIMDNIEINPKIIKYMSNELKSDIDLIQEISKSSNPEIRQELAQNCEVPLAIATNPELSNDRVFMTIAIVRDVKFLEYASDELKNDRDFLRETSSKNEEVIDYVVDNIQKFGLEGIKGVRESSRDFTIEDCMGIIDEMAEDGQDKRYEKIKSKIQERGLEDVHTVRWITAMVAQKDNVNPELVKRVLNYSLLTMEKIKQDLTDKGEMQINLNNAQELITPLILNRLRTKLELQDIEIDESMQQKLDRYQEFYDQYHTRFQEQKKQNRLKKERKTPIDMKQAIADAKITDSEVQSEMQVINEITIEDQEIEHDNNKE